MTENGILTSLNRKQYEAVIHTDGPTLIFAGAGSGKTRVLTHRIAYILEEHKTTPDRILAVTFTNKAAREMKERLEVLLGPRASYVNMGTFHSINARLLRIEAKHLDTDPNFTIYDSDDSLAVVKEAMKQLKYSTDTIQPNSVRSYISRNKQLFRLPDHAELAGDSAYLAKEKRDIYQRYQAILRRNNGYDFDDLLIEPLRLFQRDPSILNRYQYRWDYILVDEYQDTNLVQFMFLEQISARHGNICVVGDDDQSIYSWRGADIRNILDFEYKFSKPVIIKLEQNYRSTKTILKAAGALVSHNRHRHDKEIWTENGVGEKLGYHILDNAFREGDFIAATIQRAVQMGRSYGDFAVLYRTNAQSRAIEEALRNHLIKYTIIGGTKFYERKEIKDLLSYLRIIVNPADSTSLQRIINVPARKIGKTTVDRLLQFSAETGRTLWESLQYPAEAGVGASSAKVRDFLDLMVKLRSQSTDLPASEFVRLLLDRTGLIAQYETASEDLQNRERIDNLNEFVNGVSQFEEHNEDAGLEDFLQEISLLTDIDEMDDKTRSVLLMTLHSAKGLEFPVVFIPGLEEGLFPLERARENEEDLEEERRLFYVGITRAMEKVHLSTARQRMKFGFQQMQSPSSFINELPEDCVEFSSDREAQHVPGVAAFHRKRPVPRPGFSTTPGTRPSSNSEKDSITVGAHVNHKFFGKGKILAVQNGSPRILKIAFSGGVVKSIAEKFVEAVQ